MRRTDSGLVLAGRPVEDKYLELVDEAGQPVAVGEAGELIVRSPYIAEGYWRNPKETAPVFAPDPDVPGQRIYRTGDLGRFLPDGRFVFLGRRDRQVKIRGFRVELAEIEATLTAACRGARGGGCRERARAERQRAGGVRGALAGAGPDGRCTARLSTAEAGALHDSLRVRVPGGTARHAHRQDRSPGAATAGRRQASDVHGRRAPKLPRTAAGRDLASGARRRSCRNARQLLRPRRPLAARRADVCPGGSTPGGQAAARHPVPGAHHRRARGDHRPGPDVGVVALTGRDPAGRNAATPVRGAGHRGERGRLSRSLPAAGSRPALLWAAVARTQRNRESADRHRRHGSGVSGGDPPGAARGSLQSSRRVHGGRGRLRDGATAARRRRTGRSPCAPRAEGAVPDVQAGGPASADADAAIHRQAAQTLCSPRLRGSVAGSGSSTCASGSRC